MIKDKYWYKLLNHFDKKHYFRNGLTLPFIIGSRSIIEPNEELQSITELLEDSKKFNIYLSVLKCDYIGEFVFSISSLDDFNIYGGFENIVDINGDFKEIESYKQFCEILENKYLDTINNYTYSRNSYGKWEYFTEDKDLPRIKELI